jgi:hypothetical protein
MLLKQSSRTVSSFSQLGEYARSLREKPYFPELLVRQCGPVASTDAVAEQEEPRLIPRDDIWKMANKS